MRRQRSAADRHAALEGIDEGVVPRGNRVRESGAGGKRDVEIHRLGRNSMHRAGNFRIEGSGDDLRLSPARQLDHLTFVKLLGDIDLDLDSYPKLRDLKQRVEEDEPIANWIKNRPVTDL